MSKKNETELKPQAERVEKLFPSTRELFTVKIRSKASSVVYHLLRLPSKSLIRHLFSYKKENKKMASKRHFESSFSEKSLNAQKWCPQHSSLQKTIAPERIKKWRIKEALIAASKLTNVKKEEREGQKHQISLLHSNEEQWKEEMQKKEAWQDLIAQKEERHFHLTRIARFFTD